MPPKPTKQTPQTETDRRLRSADKLNESNEDTTKSKESGENSKEDETKQGQMDDQDQNAGSANGVGSQTSSPSNLSNNTGSPVELDRTESSENQKVEQPANLNDTEPLEDEDHENENLGDQRDSLMGNGSFNAPSLYSGLGNELTEEFYHAKQRMRAELQEALQASHERHVQDLRDFEEAQQRRKEELMRRAEEETKRSDELWHGIRRRDTDMFAMIDDRRKEISDWFYSQDEFFGKDLNKFKIASNSHEGEVGTSSRRTEHSTGDCNLTENMKDLIKDLYTVAGSSQEDKSKNLETLKNCLEEMQAVQDDELAEVEPAEGQDSSQYENPGISPESEPCSGFEFWRELRAASTNKEQDKLEDDERFINVMLRKYEDFSSERAVEEAKLKKLLDEPFSWMGMSSHETSKVAIVKSKFSYYQEYVRYMTMVSHLPTKLRENQLRKLDLFLADPYSFTGPGNLTQYPDGEGWSPDMLEEHLRTKTYFNSKNLKKSLIARFNKALDNKTDLGKVLSAKNSKKQPKDELTFLGHRLEVDENGNESIVKDDTDSSLSESMSSQTEGQADNQGNSSGTPNSVMSPEVLERIFNAQNAQTKAIVDTLKKINQETVANKDGSHSRKVQPPRLDPPGKFNGYSTENYEVFESRFTGWQAQTGLDDEAASIHFFNRMDDKALVYLSNIVVHGVTTLTEMKEAMREAYGNEGIRDTLLAQYETPLQDANEPAVDFAGRVRTIGKRLGKDYTQDEIKDEYNKIVTGLRSADVRFRVSVQMEHPEYKKDPWEFPIFLKNLKQAEREVSKCRKADEKMKEVEEKQKRREAAYTGEKKPKKCGRCGKLGHDAQHCPELRLFSLEEVEEVNAIKPGTTCHECGSPDHWRSDCPKLKSKEEKPSTTQNEATLKEVIEILGKLLASNKELIQRKAAKDKETGPKPQVNKSNRVNQLEEADKDKEKDKDTQDQGEAQSPSK